MTRRTTQATTETTNIYRPGGPQLSEDDLSLINENSGNSQPLRDSTFDNDRDEGFEKVERYDSTLYTPHLGDYIPPTIPRGDKQPRESSTGYQPSYSEQISVEQFAKSLHLSEEPLDSPTYWDVPESEGGNRESSSSRGNPTKNLPSYKNPYRDQNISSNSERGDERGRALQSAIGTVKFWGGKAKQWPPPLPNVLIAIMGKTGTGKTSFINAATGGSLLVGHSLQACTQKIQTAETEINGRKVIFIDTPGFDDTNRSDVDILGEITAYLQTSGTNDIKLSGVIYLHKITDSRMEGSTMKNIRMFRKLCGEGNFHNVILCTTGWDLVDLTLGEEREQELGETENFWGTMMKKGARIKRHDRKSQTSAVDIAKELVGAPPVTLQIQKELMDSPLLAETSAGKLILEEMEKLKIEHQKEMQALREDIKEAQLSNSQDEITQMRKEYEKEIQGLRKAQEELEKLRSADQIAMQNMIDDLKAELGKNRGGGCVIC